jgi:hypothetical protein
MQRPEDPGGAPSSITNPPMNRSFRSPQRVICVGSSVFPGPAGKPRFGRSLSLPYEFASFVCRSLPRPPGPKTRPYLSPSCVKLVPSLDKEIQDPRHAARPRMFVMFAVRIFIGDEVVTYFIGILLLTQIDHLASAGCRSFLD